MIGWLQGKIIDKHHPGKLVIDVQGVGYDVETSLATFFQVEEMIDIPVALHIHTIVREDAFILYGFVDKQERALFRALIKVNGVGPKMAIAILSSITPAEFIHCIQQQNTALLVKLPGIGSKTAQRLVIEMKDSLGQLPLTLQQAVKTGSPTLTSQTEAVNALESLGYKTQEAVKAVQKVDNGQLTCEELIRQALRIL